MCAKRFLDALQQCSSKDKTFVSPSVTHVTRTHVKSNNTKAALPAHNSSHGQTWNCSPADPHATTCHTYRTRLVRYAALRHVTPHDAIPAHDGGERCTFPPTDPPVRLPALRIVRVLWSLRSVRGQRRREAQGKGPGKNWKGEKEKKKKKRKKTLRLGATPWCKK